MILFDVYSLIAEFVELIQTDREFQMKVGGITGAVLAGAVLAGRGRKFYSVQSPEHFVACSVKQNDIRRMINNFHILLSDK